MNRRTFHRACVLSCLLLSLPVAAQQGHPLTGTWAGDWASAPNQRTHITMVLNWDGEKVSGILNPGPDSVALNNIAVDVASWTVRIEAESRDKSGAAVRVSVEGRLEDIGSLHRTLSGTWRQGTASGDFKVTRD